MPLADDWRECTTSDGRTFYRSDSLGHSTYKTPEEFEELNGGCWPEFESGYSSKGKRWWRDRETKEVFWADPLETRRLRGSEEMRAECVLTGLTVFAPECDLLVRAGAKPHLRPTGAIFYHEDPLPRLLERFESGALESAGGVGGDGKFRDPGYFFDGAHSYDHPGDPAPNGSDPMGHSGTYVYRRPGAEEHLYGPWGMSAGDIKQGALGDCWLLGAIAAVAEKFPRILTANLNYDGALGAFSLRHRDPETGAARWLLCDDLFPVKKEDETDHLFVTSAEAHEMWSVFLEKAFSKWLGGYMNCRGGVQNTRVQSVEPMQALSFATEGRRWRGDLAEREAESPDLWGELLSLSEEGWLLTAAGKGGGADTRDPETGIVKNHLFSVLDLVETELDEDKGSFVEGFMPWLEGEAGSSGELPRKAFLALHNETGEAIKWKYSRRSVKLGPTRKYYEWKKDWTSEGDRDLYVNDDFFGECSLGDAVHARRSGNIEIRTAEEVMSDELAKRAGRIRRSRAYAYWEENAPTRTLRLVKCRNPWGRGEWLGLWSDSSPAWRYYAAVARDVGFTDSDDGTFFIQWADFCAHFRDVRACGAVAPPGGVLGGAAAGDKASLEAGDEVVAKFGGHRGTHENGLYFAGTVAEILGGAAVVDYCGGGRCGDVGPHEIAYAPGRDPEHRSCHLPPVRTQKVHRDWSLEPHHAARRRKLELEPGDEVVAHFGGHRGTEDADLLLAAVVGEIRGDAATVHYCDGSSCDDIRPGEVFYAPGRPGDHRSESPPPGAETFRAVLPGWRLQQGDEAGASPDVMPDSLDDDDGDESVPKLDGSCGQKGAWWGCLSRKYCF